MAGWLRDIYNRILADDESESEASGYLSHRGEWHSAAWGFAAGFVAFATGHPEFLAVAVGWIFTRSADRKIPGIVPYPSQLKKEPLYVIAHVIPGAALGLVAQFLLGGAIALPL